MVHRVALGETRAKSVLLFHRTLPDPTTALRPLLAAFSSQGQSELLLLLKVQEFCYDNIHFIKAFSKILVLFYKADVLSQEAILKWDKEAHSPKGKSVFLEQMRPFYGMASERGRRVWVRDRGSLRSGPRDPHPRSMPTSCWRDATRALDTRSLDTRLCRCFWDR